MSRPLAISKLPQALRDRAGKITDTATSTYLLQAADAIDDQRKKIAELRREIKESEEFVWYMDDNGEWWKEEKQ